MSQGMDRMGAPNTPWSLPVLSDQGGALAAAMLKRVRAAALMTGTQEPTGSLPHLSGGNAGRLPAGDLQMSQQLYLPSSQLPQQPVLPPFPRLLSPSVLVGPTPQTPRAPAVPLPPPTSLPPPPNRSTRWGGTASPPSTPPSPTGGRHPFTEQTVHCSRQSAACPRPPVTDVLVALRREEETVAVKAMQPATVVVMTQLQVRAQLRVAYFTSWGSSSQGRMPRTSSCLGR